MELITKSQVYGTADPEFAIFYLQDDERVQAWSNDGNSISSEKPKAIHCSAIVNLSRNDENFSFAALGYFIHFLFLCIPQMFSMGPCRSVLMRIVVRVIIFYKKTQ